MQPALFRAKLQKQSDSPRCEPKQTKQTEDEFIGRSATDKKDCPSRDAVSHTNSRRRRPSIAIYCDTTVFIPNKPDASSQNTSRNNRSTLDCSVTLLPLHSALVNGELDHGHPAYLARRERRLGLIEDNRTSCGVESMKHDSAESGCCICPIGHCVAQFDSPASQCQPFRALTGDSPSIACPCTESSRCASWRTCCGGGHLTCCGGGLAWGWGGGCS